MNYIKQLSINICYTLECMFIGLIGTQIDNNRFRELYNFMSTSLHFELLIIRNKTSSLNASIFRDSTVSKRCDIAQNESLL